MWTHATAAAAAVALAAAAMLAPAAAQLSVGRDTAAAGSQPPFSFRSTTHVNTPNPCPLSCRGAHYVVALDDPQARAPMVAACGILGQIATLHLGNSTAPPSLAEVETSAALEQARTLSLVPGMPSHLLVAATDYLVYDVSDPAKAQLVANVSTPMSHGGHWTGDNGINGVVWVPTDASTSRRASTHGVPPDRTLLVGAAMPGMLIVAQLHQPVDVTTAVDAAVAADAPAHLPRSPASTLSYVGCLDLTSADGGSGPRLERGFDIDVSSTDASSMPEGVTATVVVVAASGSGVLATFGVDPSTDPSKWQQIGASWAAPAMWGTTHTGCNRVRVNDGIAFASCFGVSEHGIVVAVAMTPSLAGGGDDGGDGGGGGAPQLLWQRSFADKQPTGMLIAGHALFVAGGQDVMVWDVSNASNATLVVPTCGDACVKALPGDGQNAHSMAVMQVGGTNGEWLLVGSAQVSNNVGVLVIDDPSVVALLEAST